MSSIRQQIVDTVETRLGQIAPGYVFNLPDGPYTCGSTILAVRPWRKVPFGKNQVPAIKFRDTDAPVEPGPSTQHQHTLTIAIEVDVAGSTSPDTARGIMEDIIAAIGSDPRWNNLARHTDINSHEIDVEQAGDVVTGVSINITITYRTKLWRM